MSRFSARAVTALSVAVLLGVAACGPGEEELPPIPTPTTPTTASPTTAAATPTTQAPTPEASPTVDTVRPEIDIPEPKKYPEMANDDIQGADTAARYFLDLYGYAYNTGDLSAFKKMSAPDCGVCNVVIEQVEEAYDNGEWFENFARLHGETLIYYPTEDEPDYLVVIHVRATDYEHYDANGEPLPTAPEKIYPDYGVFVEYIAPYEWVVNGAVPLGSQGAQE